MLISESALRQAGLLVALDPGGALGRCGSASARTVRCVLIHAAIVPSRRAPRQMHLG